MSTSFAFIIHNYAKLIYYSNHHRPAKLTSFGLVNFNNNKGACYELAKTVMRVAESHGLVIPSITMEISRSDRLLEELSVNYTGRDAVEEVRF